MKHGVKPTREQRKAIEAFRLHPVDWLVVKDTPTEMLLVHRNFDNVTRVIRKAVPDDAE